MSTGGYIFKRVFSAIPLLFIVSIISFGIIRLNITINSINLFLLLFWIIALIIFYLISGKKNLLIWLSIISLVWFSLYLSKFNLLPFDFILRNKGLLLFLNFFFIFLFLFTYWLQAFITKSSFLSKCIVLIMLLIMSVIAGNYLHYNIPVKQIVLKSGDPLADLKFNPAISKEVLELEVKRLGLDEPLHIQYLFWLKGLMHGDLGITQQNQSVIKVIQKPIFNTLILSLCTLICTWTIAIPLGIWAALKQNKFIDRFFAILTTCGMSTPTFILAVIGLLFALSTQLIPIGGLTSFDFSEMNRIERFFDILKHLILPTVVLTLVSIASLQRQMRANLLDVLRQEYIKTAIAKGLPTNMVIYKHALRNAINPLITIFGFEFGSLLSGAALTETILSYPGLGALTLEAARKADVNLTMVTLILGALMLITGNLVADLLLKFADPRIKFSEA